MKLLESAKREIDSIIQMYILHENHEIIISLLPPLAKLNNHAHEACQFGTSFENDFTFFINNEGTRVTKDIIYDIGGRVPHSANSPHKFAITTLDIKYFCREGASSGQEGIKTEELAARTVAPGIYRQTYENLVFSYDTYTFEDLGSMELGGGDYDYIIASTPGVCALEDTVQELEELRIYQPQRNKNYELAGKVPHTRVVCIRFK